MLVDMPTYDTSRQRGTRRGRILLQRVGHELHQARTGAGVGAREVASAAGISHTQVLRIERATAPHVDLDVLARVAAAVGHELAIAIHPVGPPVRDVAHLKLLGRLRSCLPASVRWQAEVPMPITGDARSADALLTGETFRAIVEAETRLADVQATERRIAAKARDLGVDRVILLVLDSRHNRDVIATTPELSRRFPVATRDALWALRRGRDPGGDCLIRL